MYLYTFMVEELQTLVKTTVLLFLCNLMLTYTSVSHSLLSL